jgi:uncharacterized OB-fold protein
MQAFVYPTTGLKEAALTGGEVVTVAGAPEARYAWDAGVAIGRYLAELKNGRLVGRVCHQCRRTLIPPRMFCERCFRPTDDWVYVQDTGTIKTFSICYVTWDMVRLEQPQIPAVIDIDGASRGMGILHLLGEVDPAQVHIGLRVQAVWKPAAERSGAITDILHWRPLGEAETPRRPPGRRTARDEARGQQRAEGRRPARARKSASKARAKCEQSASKSARASARRRAPASAQRRRPATVPGAPAEAGRSCDAHPRPYHPPGRRAPWEGNIPSSLGTPPGSPATAGYCAPCAMRAASTARAARSARSPTCRPGCSASAASSSLATRPGRPSGRAASW